MYDDHSGSRYSSRSPRKLDYDEEDGFKIRGRDSGSNSNEHHEREPAEVIYTSSDDRYAREDGPRYRQNDRPPPAKRPYRGREYEREPYEEAYYEEAPLIDLSYHGENDVSQDGRPLRLLLVRNLKESVTEELFAKGLEKLNRNLDSTSPETVGATEGSLRRVIIVRDRTTNKSMAFGFAEYHSISEATAALAKAGDLGDKCTISSKVVAVSFPHLTVFPRADFGVEEKDERFTVEMPSTGARHKYHDLRYYASELMVNEDAPSSPPKKSAGDGAGSEATQPHVGTLESKEKGTKKRKTPGSSTSAATPAFLQHWQNKAAELRSEEEKVTASAQAEKEAKKTQLPISGVNAITAPAPPTVSNQQTFSVDTQRLKCCYLCACQFQTSEGLQRHLKESAKHASNLKDDAVRGKGYERLKKAGVTEHGTTKLLIAPSVDSDEEAAATTDMQYRDRAAERRKVATRTGTQENVPSFSLKGAKPKHIPSSSSTAAADTSEPIKPSYGKGMNMLQKAGWSAGQGLGDGSGVAAPIDQMVYAAGVGLGHDSSKMGDAVEEAARMTKGERGGFLEKTKEVARQRYERMM